MPQEKRRAAIYARTAVIQELGQSFSNAEQIRQSQEYCLKKGYTLLDVYEEVGSGYLTLPERHFMISAIQDAKEGKFDVLVIYDYSRLSRNTATLTEIIKMLEEAGVKVESVTEDETLKLFIDTILEKVSETRKERISARSKAGRKNK